MNPQRKAEIERRCADVAEQARATRGRGDLDYEIRPEEGAGALQFLKPTFSTPLDLVTSGMLQALGPVGQRALRDVLDLTRRRAVRPAAWRMREAKTKHKRGDVRYFGSHRVYSVGAKMNLLQAKVCRGRLEQRVHGALRCCNQLQRDGVMFGVHSAKPRCVVRE